MKPHNAERFIMVRGIINQEIQKENNISIVLRALRNIPDCTRTKLVESTGLTAAAVTKIINTLYDWDIVYESEPIGSGIGRHAKVLHLNSKRFRVIGARINREYVVAAVFDPDGKMYEYCRADIDAADGAHHSMDRLTGLIRHLIDHSDTPVTAIGIAVPGPFNYNKKEISLMSGFPGWKDINIQSEIENAVHIPVFVDHDANCGALAQIWHADVEPNADMLFVVADRGIGAALYLKGTIYRGANGYAGELGHSSINIFGPRCECGNRGCVELYGSATALKQAYLTESFDPSDPSTLVSGITSDKLMALIRAGDPAACRAYSKTVGYLCFGVVSLINSLNPNVIIFADKMIEGGSLFLETARRTFKAYLLPEVYENLSVQCSAIEGDPMLLGSSVLAFDHIFEKPCTYLEIEESKNGQ